jgi:heme/copper-type cytochrome/quinol oxidase subunit 2
MCLLMRLYVFVVVVYTVFGLLYIRSGYSDVTQSSFGQNLELNLVLAIHQCFRLNFTTIPQFQNKNETPDPGH